MRSVFGTYDTRKFTDVWGDAQTFLTDFQNSGLDGDTTSRTIADTAVNTLYYLLYSAYGNSHVANSDENQFKYKVFSTIFMYGPSWAKRLDIQKKLRELSDDEILIGTKQIFNHSFNPSTEPSTSTLEELTTINEQNTNTVKKGKLDAYTMLWSIITTDVTKEFIDKFKKCFLQVAQPQRPLWYVSEEEN